MTIQEGKTPPAFTLSDANGNSVSLRALKGQDVIVFFYPKDDTSGCTKEACGFRDVWDELQNRNVTVLGISADDAEAHGRFAKKYDLPFPLLSDPDRKVMRAYGAYGEKMMYGKKTVGVIRSTVWVGADGKVKKHWRRVGNAAKHPAQVVQVVLGQRQ